MENKKLKIYIYDISNFFKGKRKELLIFAYDKKQADEIIKQTKFKDAPYLKTSKSNRNIQWHVKIYGKGTEQGLLDNQEKMIRYWK